MATQTVPVGQVFPWAFIPSICGQRICGDGSVCYGIPGVPPIGATIVGSFLVGDGHEVGGTPSTQFGTPVGVNLIAQSRTMVGLGSPAAFGVPTVKLWKTPAGVSSAQAFGAVKTAVRTAPLAGVPSAQSFGVLKFALKAPIGVGVPSAQAFGTPTIKATIARAVGSVSSAQSFGAVTVKTAVSQPSGGVGSAQLFGALTIRTAIARVVGGVASAQAFGVPAGRIGLVTLFPGGVPSAQAFGLPRFTFAFPVSGVASAQLFGTPTARSITRVSFGGVPSAQSFGAVNAWIAYLHPLECLTSPNLALCGFPICGDGTICGGEPWLLGEVCLDSPNAAIVGTFLVGDGTRVGGEPFLLDTSESTLVLSALGTTTLDLQVVSPISVDLEPAGVR